MSEPERPHPLDALVVAAGPERVAELLCDAFERAISGPDGDYLLAGWIKRASKAAEIRG